METETSELKRKHMDSGVEDEQMGKRLQMDAANPVEKREEDDDDDSSDGDGDNPVLNPYERVDFRPHQQRQKNKPRKDCPYLDTIQRTALDFDFEKVCSVTLSNVNVYACLVCGKYFQGSDVLLLINILLDYASFFIFHGTDKTKQNTTQYNTTQCNATQQHSYIQGRGRKTPAYAHSLEAAHHVYIHLENLKIYCLPD